jgi:NAD(P)-dependent dehydrogenase (short-subunit alcohol dehydrogenase family)
MSEKIALVTGANRGIGVEVCRQLAKRNYHVILTSRDREKGEKKVRELAEEGLNNITYRQLDTQNLESIKQVEQFIKKDFGRLDILVNNAAVLLDRSEDEQATVLSVSPNVLRNTIETNLFGPFFMCQHLIPIMLKQNYGRVVNVSSHYGSLTDMGADAPTYRISKTALNGVTRVFAAQLVGTNVLVNSVCPGWVKTDMGGPFAPRSIDKGAETIVWAATLPENGPTGGFFQDKKALEW